MRTHSSGECCTATPPSPNAEGGALCYLRVHIFLFFFPLQAAEAAAQARGSTAAAPFCQHLVGVAVLMLRLRCADCCCRDVLAAVDGALAMLLTFLWSLLLLLLLLLPSPFLLLWQYGGCMIINLWLASPLVW